MLIAALKPGHDGALAAVRDGELVCSLEAEKDSRPRYSPVLTTTMLQLAEELDQIPDVIALGGWGDVGSMRIVPTGAGYTGTHEPSIRTMSFFGKDVTLFSSTHERSHVYMALGMAPQVDVAQRAVLVWEGDIGAFYLLDAQHRITSKVRVLTAPGARFAFLFALADPTFGDVGCKPRLNDAGKLMALAGFGDPENAHPDAVAVVDRIMKEEALYPAPKADYRDTAMHNAGVESTICKDAAALLTRRIFEAFFEAAQEHLPPGIPLAINGGCGLNCDWNRMWVNTGYFSDVFVPPCTNDSGSAIGSAIDAQTTLTGSPGLTWNVYAGLPFVHDVAPNPQEWQAHPLDAGQLAAAVAHGRVVAWVQGRWEIGPRALGNRSLLAEPFSAATKKRLNEIKKREDYRPIAPVARVEDLAAVFHEDFEDPHMLYFRRVREASGLHAVTHVDGSARAQTVRSDQNPRLHRLLSRFANHRDLGVLCNTSLNFNGEGFINRMSDLELYCTARGVDDMVVDDRWYVRRR